MSSTITKTFHKFANPTGFAWKLTPDEIKNTYFEEFRSAKEGIPLEKCVYPSFRAIHVNKDGTYMSKKAEKIDEKVKAIVAERGEGADVNQIYMEVNREELRKKQRMYGTGSLVSSLMSDASSGGSSSQLHSSRLEEVEKQLQEEREKRQQLEERFLATQEMVQQMAEQLSQHQSHIRTSGDDRRDG